MRLIIILIIVYFSSCQKLEKPRNIIVIPNDISTDFLKISKDSLIRIVGGYAWKNGYISTYSNNQITIDTSIDVALLNIKYDSINLRHLTTGMNGINLDIGASIKKLPTYSNDINRDILIEKDRTFLIGGKSYKLGHIHVIDNQNKSLIKTLTFDHELQAIVKLEDTYIVVGYGLVITSIDGEKWKKTDLSGDFFNSITKVNEHSAYTSGQNSSIFKTIDKGTSWSSLRVPGNQQVNNIQYFENKLYLLCNKGFLKIYDELNENWSSYKLTNYDLYDCILIDKKLLTVGENGYAALVAVD